MTRAFWHAAFVVVCTSFTSASADDVAVRDATISLFRSVREITTEPGAPLERITQSLQQLSNQHPGDAIVLYSLAEAARRRQNAKQLATALAEVPDDAASAELAAVNSLHFAARAGDLSIFEASASRFCRLIRSKGESGFAITDPMRRVLTLKAALAWRSEPGRPVAVDAVQRAIDRLAPQVNAATATPHEFWPDELPLTIKGYREALARQSAVAEEENRRNPTVEEELARIRSIRDEIKYQVEIQRFKSTSQQARNGRLTGPQWRKFERMQAAEPAIAAVFEREPGAAPWRMALRVWVELLLDPANLPWYASGLWDNLGSKTGWDWLELALEKELLRRMHPDAVGRQLAQRIDMNNLYRVSTPDSVERRRKFPTSSISADELNRELQAAVANHLLSPHLACVIAIGAMLEGDDGLARQALAAGVAAEPTVRQTPAVRVLCDLRSADLDALAASLKAFQERMPVQRAKTTVEHTIQFSEHRLLHFVRRWLPEATASPVARQCHEQVSRGIARSRELLADNPETEVWVKSLDDMSGDLSPGTWIPFLLDDLLKWCARDWKNLVVAFPTHE